MSTKTDNFSVQYTYKRKPIQWVLKIRGKKKYPKWMGSFWLKMFLIWNLNWIINKISLVLNIWFKQHHTVVLISSLVTSLGWYWYQPIGLILGTKSKHQCDILYLSYHLTACDPCPSYIPNTMSSIFFQGYTSICVYTDTFTIDNQCPLWAYPRFYSGFTPGPI